MPLRKLFLGCRGLFGCGAGLGFLLVDGFRFGGAFGFFGRFGFSLFGEGHGEDDGIAGDGGLDAFGQDQTLINSGRQSGRQEMGSS